MKWILELVQKKPIQGLLAALLMGISTMGTVCMHLYNEKNQREETIIRNERFYMQSKASSDSAHKVEILAIKDKANLEVHDYLVAAKNEMEQRIKELQMINSGREVIYSTNKEVVNHNRAIIKKLNSK